VINIKAMNVYVLLSGGIDSTCCVYFYRQAGHAVTGVFVDYGQSVSKQEEQSAKAVTEHYGIPLHIVRSSGPRREFAGEIAGRNAFLTFACLLHMHQVTGLIVLGIHSGGTYYDCSEHFTGHLNALLSGYSDGKVAMAAPFLAWSKQAVYDYSLKNDVPVRLTWSCEVGPFAPCGHCLSCEDRAHLNVCPAK
jgi:7-cyano-7-deazaguanine synthase